MFGMGFTEILLIAVIAILFIGPDKLPSTMVDIAKFFRNVKNTIGSVKDTLEDELNINEIKQEALAYKAELENASSKLSQVTDVKSQINEQIDSITDSVTSDSNSKSKNKNTQEKVTFKKKKKEKKKENKEEINDV